FGSLTTGAVAGRTATHHHARRTAPNEHLDHRCVEVADAADHVHVRSLRAEGVDLLSRRLRTADRDGRFRSEVPDIGTHNQSHIGELVATGPPRRTDTHGRTRPGTDAATHAAHRIHQRHEGRTVIVPRHHGDRFPGTILRALVATGAKP